MTAPGDTALGLVLRIPMRAGDGYGGGGGYSGGSGYGGLYPYGAAGGAVGGAVLIAVLVIAIAVFTVKVTKVYRPSAIASGSTGTAALDLPSAYAQMQATDRAFNGKAFDVGARRIFDTVQTGWTTATRISPGR